MSEQEVAPGSETTEPVDRHAVTGVVLQRLFAGLVLASLSLLLASLSLRFSAALPLAVGVWWLALGMVKARRRELPFYLGAAAIAAPVAGFIAHRSAGVVLAAEAILIVAAGGLVALGIDRPKSRTTARPNPVAPTTTLAGAAIEDGVPARFGVQISATRLASLFATLILLVIGAVWSVDRRVAELYESFVYATATWACVMTFLWPGQHERAGAGLRTSARNTRIRSRS